MRNQLCIDFFENLNEKTTLKMFERIYAKDAYFKDPFNEVNSLGQIYNIFADMYKTLQNPKFKIKEVISQENVMMIRWDFIFYFKKDSKVQGFEGVSRLEFDSDDKIISHIDYWDSSANVYEKIPFLGWFIRLVKNKIKSHS